MSNKEYTEEDEDEFFKALELDNEANENTMLKEIVWTIIEIMIVIGFFILCAVIPDYVAWVLIFIVMPVMTVGLLRASYQDLVNRDNVKK